MGAEYKEQLDIVTQLSVGGFNEHIRAKDLVEFLENEIGLVWRCRLKASWTPPESYPNFDITEPSKFMIEDGYTKVVPHAFVHFVSCSSRDRAMEAAKRSSLVFRDLLLKVSLGPENPFTLNLRRRKINPLKIPNVRLEIGSLANYNKYLVGWRETSSDVELIVDPFDSTCKFCFSKDVAFSFKNSSTYDVIKCDFKVEFLVRDIMEVKKYNENYCLVALLHLGNAPRLWYRTADDDVELTVPFDLLDDDDPWIRTTDFTPSNAIGRCNYYRVSVSPRHGAKLERAMEYLMQQRVRIETIRYLRVVDEKDFGKPTNDHFFSIHIAEGLPFDVLYMLNVVLHKGVINQHQLSEDVYNILRTQPTDVSLAALKQLYSCKHPVLDLHRKLKYVSVALGKNSSLFQTLKQPEYFSQIRRVIITPTRAYCFPPETELSNRVIRHYREMSDRFIRVTFMDEGMQNINSNAFSYFVAPIVRDITSNSFPQKTRLFKRVKDIVETGFTLCGKRYSFLAFSSNQLRDRSAWFFEEDKVTTVQKIKNWMGRFTDKNVAKYAARMGQCFSSTYATVTVPHSKVEFDYPDVQRNNYTFSDGIGMISPDLANEVAVKLKLEAKPPCAYQIRFAGCKGVVACWPPPVEGKELIMRKSMKKFISSHTTLEICSWSKFQPGFLNRQIIILLTALRVPEEIFWDMQESMVSKLNKMLVDPEVAFDVLAASCAEDGETPAIMLSAGFRPNQEPHLRGMLSSIRAAQLWGLREKSRIFVNNGRWLLGCFDELGVLEEGQCFIRVSKPCLETCFVNHGGNFEVSKEFEVLEAVVAIAKNPCLHPGDVRILRAVDAPELHHLYDCLVFPQKGQRPHADEASGSDLDGDIYFVTWDEHLIPPDKKSCAPMQYDATTAKTQKTVEHKDIIEFFWKNMVNEDLGTICNAHVVLSDRREAGALDEDCIKLAELAATAVDFPKTGKIVKMPPHLRPKLYPDFMGKELHQTYNSEKILGRMYRRVKCAYDDGVASSSEMTVDPGEIHYDEDLEIECSDECLLDAWEKKCSYDTQMIGLLGQYKVKKEEEIVTGHVWSMPKYASRKQGDLKEKLMHSYSVLRKEFRHVFEDLGEENLNISAEERNGLLERRASAWYKVAYHPRWVTKAMELRGENEELCTPILSFPWIAADYLARIKIRRRQDGEALNISKPINSLVKYLNDRV